MIEGWYDGSAKSQMIGKSEYGLVFTLLWKQALTNSKKFLHLIQFSQYTTYFHTKVVESSQLLDIRVVLSHFHLWKQKGRLMLFFLIQPQKLIIWLRLNTTDHLLFQTQEIWTIQEGKAYLWNYIQELTSPLQSYRLTNVGSVK